MEKKLTSAGLELSDGESLTRNPRDFPEVNERVTHAIRRKNFITRKPVPDDLIFDGAKLVRAATDFARDARPLLDFGWSVMG
jgi:uncharacterized protein (DUF2461 family)